MTRCPLAGCWRFPSSEAALCLHLFAEHGFGATDAGTIAHDTYAGDPPQLLPVDGRLVNFAPPRWPDEVFRPNPAWRPGPG